MIYTAYCTSCKRKQTYTQTVEHRNVTPTCDKCSGTTEKIMDAPRISSANLEEHKAFKSSIDGRTYQGQTSYLKHMAQHGKVPYEKGEAEHQRKNIEIAQDRQLEKDIDSVLTDHQQGKL